MENIQDLDSSLQSIGHDYLKLSDNVKVYLNQIYDYKIDITNQLDESLSELQDSYFSIARISEVLNCSRTTIYNNLVIKEYIDKINEDFNKNNPYKKIEALEREVKDLNDKLDKMYQRDVELLLIQKENTEIKKRLKKENNIKKIVEN